MERSLARSSKAWLYAVRLQTTIVNKQMEVQMIVLIIQPAEWLGADWQCLSSRRFGMPGDNDADSCAKRTCQSEDRPTSGHAVYSSMKYVLMLYTK